MRSANTITNANRNGWVGVEAKSDLRQLGCYQWEYVVHWLLVSLLLHLEKETPRRPCAVDGATPVGGQIINKCL